jgi:hypothetical protein
MAISRTGYKAELAAPGRSSFDEQATPDQTQEREYRELRGKALLTGAAVIMIIALILTGNAWKARAKGQTSASLRKLAALQPKTARVMRGGTEADVPIERPCEAGTLSSCAQGSALPWTVIFFQAPVSWMSPY